MYDARIKLLEEQIEDLSLDKADMELEIESLTERLIIAIEALQDIVNLDMPTGHWRIAQDALDRLREQE